VNNGKKISNYYYQTEREFSHLIEENTRKKYISTEGTRYQNAVTKG